MFGETAAVYGFIRISRALSAIASRLFYLLVVEYFDDFTQLEALKSMPMALERSLSAPVTLSVYKTLRDAQNSSPGFAARWMSPDEKQRFFIGNIRSAPAGTLAGDLLLGSISYGK